MKIYDNRWNEISSSSVNLELGYLCDTTRKIEISPAHEDWVIWDANRNLGMSVFVPAQYEYENCQQYITYSNEELVNLYKKQLADTDYVFIKCYEAYVLGETLPYEQDYIQELSVQRNAIRQKINNLEAM